MHAAEEDQEEGDEYEEEFEEGQYYSIGALNLLCNFLLKLGLVLL